jgi:hypothetical protein
MPRASTSYSGRALRFMLWRLPLGVTRYSVARNTAVITEEGRRWLALAGFGAWVAAFWWLALWLHRTAGLLVPLQVASLLGLLLIWRIVGHLRRLWVHRRNLTNMAVSVQRQRQMYQMQEQALDLLRQGASRAIPAGRTFTMGGVMRHHDPAADEHARIAREQATQARGWLPPEHRDVPLGDRFEPILRLPKWLRRPKP